MTYYKQIFSFTTLVFLGAAGLFFDQDSASLSSTGNILDDRIVTGHKTNANFGSQGSNFLSEEGTGNFHYANFGTTITDLRVEKGEPLSNIPAIDLNTDSDGDGVPDHLDLDDDNDGILDANECATASGNMIGWYNSTDYSPFVTASISSFLSGQNSTTGSGLTRTRETPENYQRISQVAASSEAQAIANSEYVEYEINVGSRYLLVNQIGYYAILSSWDNTSYTFSVRMSDDNFSTSIGVLGARTYNPNGTNIVENTTQPLYLRPNTIYTFRVYFYGVSGGNSANFGHDDFRLLGFVECDTDGDGIPNRLDLDSDNDGCSDAIEGAASLTALVNSNMLGGNVNATSGTFNQPVVQNLGNNVNQTVGSNSYGVPIVAGSGQAVGTSQTANPVLVAGTASANQTIASGTAPATLTLTGATGAIQWQISTDNSTFTNVTSGSGGTTANYSPGALTATRYYRVLLTSVGGCTVISNTVTITVCSAGTVAPAVIKGTNANYYNTLGYVIPCGSAKANLTGIAASNKPTPATVTLTWHSASPATNANKIANISALTGTTKYYAAFFDSVNACYSPTTEIVVFAPICAANDDFTATPIVSETGGTLPSIYSNDSYNGITITSMAAITAEWVAEYWQFNEITTINDNGTLVVPAGLTPGVYTNYYKLRDKDPDAGSKINDSEVVAVTFRVISCTNPPNTEPATDFTKTGVSNLEGFANGWPNNVANGFIAIESKKSGFVITRVKNANDVSNPVAGMLVYDINAKCVKLYNGTTWKCLEKDCLTTAPTK